MVFRSFRSCLSWLACTLGILVSLPAEAKDFFLTIGGGHSPTSNQVSLERNVVFFQQLLADQRSDQPPQSVFFADGERPGRDLQYRDKGANCSPSLRILAELMGDTDELTLRYRDHELSGVRGPSRLNPIRRQFGRWAREMSAGDRLFIYATAHGGSSDDENPYNTVLYLWDDEQISVGEFTKLLDRLPKGVTVVLVMVQCHSGGFAHAIFERGDQELGLSPQVRCGFFSQEHDKAAAGCTPDVDEADYQEYSTFFWAAIAGKTRLGVSLPPVDYDGDGKTSLDEAHAYATIESDTIDMPIRSSDALLRHYSRLGNYKSRRPPTSSGNESGPSGGLAGFVRALAGGNRRANESYDESDEYDPYGDESQRDVIETDAEQFEDASPVQAHEEMQRGESGEERSASDEEDEEEAESLAESSANRSASADDESLDDQIERDADLVAAVMRGEDPNAVRADVENSERNVVGEDADVDSDVDADDDSAEDDLSSGTSESDSAAHSDEAGRSEDPAAAPLDAAVNEKIFALTGSLQAIGELASPVDKEVITQLMSKLELPQEMTVEMLRDRIREQKRKRFRLAQRLGRSGMRYEELKQELRQAVIQHWPELEGTYTPKLSELLGAESEELIKFVEDRSEYRIFKKTAARLESGGDESLRAVKEEAKLRRLYQTARRVILEANLREIAEPAVVQYYEQLIAAERSCIKE